MTIALGLDVDADASATYRRNFPEAAFIERDIAAVTPDEVAECLGDSGGLPLLLSACAPCQPYSNFHGARRPDPRRTLLLRLVPFLDRLQPDLVFVENVPGLDTSATAGTFARFCKALRTRGFHIAHEVVACHEYGIPQSRRRLLLMASRFGPISLPQKTHGRGAGRQPVSTVWEWIGDLPPIAAGESHPSIPNHLASKLTDLNLRRMKATPPGGGRADWPPELRLLCHQDHDGHSDVYGRMHAGTMAPALTTKCTSISNGRFGHPYQDRPISVREAASLQTFPRDFEFEGGIKSATRQVGNAVPVLLAQRAGEAFKQHLQVATTRSAKP